MFLAHKSSVALAASLAISIASARAQSPVPPQEVAFEAATIRPAALVPQAQRVLPSRIEFISTSLQTLIHIAFRLERWELYAPPMAERFDIRATYPEGTSREQVPEMLQTLLRQRFGLVAHREPRQMDAYDLVVGPEGIKMREVQAVNDLDRKFYAPSDPQPASDTAAELFNGPVRSFPALQGMGLTYVTSRSLFALRYIGDTETIDATRMSMLELARSLRMNLNRPVIDRTGLTGLYQFKLVIDTPAAFGRPPDPTGVSTFKSVEGLGLKLEKRKAPIDVFVIDKVSRVPTPN